MYYVESKDCAAYENCFTGSFTGRHRSTDVIRGGNRRGQEGESCEKVRTGYWKMDSCRVSRSYGGTECCARGKLPDCFIRAAVRFAIVCCLPESHICAANARAF